MKTLFDLTTEIAEAAGVSSPIPPLYDVVLSIYEQLGGSQTDFLSIYDILQAMLDEGLVSGGGITPSGFLEIVTNGTYNVTQYASASVNVPQGVFPEGTLNITENGEYEVRNYDSASISVPQGIFPSGNLSITENGDYNVENFVSTSVNVPQGVFPSGNLNITENGNYEVAGYESASVSIQGSGGSVFDDLANAGYSAQDIAAVENMGEADVAFTETLYEDTSAETYFYRKFYNNKSLTYAPKIDTSNGTRFENMFEACAGLIFVPSLNTSEGTLFNSMFSACSNLRVVERLDLSKGTSFNSMFKDCGLLSSLPTLSFGTGSCNETFRNCSNLSSIQADTSNVTSGYAIFQGCRALTSVSLDLSSATNLSYAFQDCTNLVSANISTSEVLSTVGRMFRSCNKLVTVSKLNFTSPPTNNLTGNERPFYGCSALENVGGFTGLKHSMSLQDCPLLTLQSVINILTEAVDLTGQTGATLTLHADAKARLTQAEYDLAASKNWTIA